MRTVFDCQVLSAAACLHAHLKNTVSSVQKDECIVCHEECDAANPNVVLPCIGKEKLQESDEITPYLHPVCKGCILRGINYGSFPTNTKPLSCPACRQMYTKDCRDYIGQHIDALTLLYEGNARRSRFEDFKQEQERFQGEGFQEGALVENRPPRPCLQRLLSCGANIKPLMQSMVIPGIMSACTFAIDHTIEAIPKGLGYGSLMVLTYNAAVLSVEKITVRVQNSLDSTFNSYRYLNYERDRNW